MNFSVSISIFAIFCSVASSGHIVFIVRMIAMMFTNPTRMKQANAGEGLPDNRPSTASTGARSTSVKLNTGDVSDSRTIPSTRTPVERGKNFGTTIRRDSFLGSPGGTMPKPGTERVVANTSPSEDHAWADTWEGEDERWYKPWNNQSQQERTQRNMYLDVGLPGDSDPTKVRGALDEFGLGSYEELNDMFSRIGMDNSKYQVAGRTNAWANQQMRDARSAHPISQYIRQVNMGEDAETMSPELLQQVAKWKNHLNQFRNKSASLKLELMLMLG